MRKLIVTATQLILLALFASSSSIIAEEPAAKPTAKIDGKWFGKLNVGPVNLRLVFDVEETDGKLNAVMTSLDQGNAKLKFDSFELKDGDVMGEIGRIGGTYKATFSGDKLAGTWKQGGQEFPLEMKRITEVPKQEILSVWRGNLETGGQTLEVQFRHLKNDKGEKELVFDSLTQGATNIAAIIKTDGDDVVIKVPTIGATYTATKKGDKVTGTWKQPGVELPLEVAMVESAKTEISPPDRPQHPKMPYPYREEFVKFDGGGKDVKLAGTITLPKKAGDATKKYPAVVLVTGSGPQDRDETLMGHKPFLVIADHLTRNGIAVLRYDERGVGESTGKFHESTSRDFANDARAAVKFLAKHPEVDARRLGIVGHSEGGLIAPIVDVDEPGLLRHIVLLAGPGIDGATVLTGQSAAIYSAMDGGEEEIKTNTKIVEQVNQAILDDMSDEDFDNLVDRISKEATEMDQSDGKMDEDEMKMMMAGIKSRLSMFKTPWFRYFIKYDPATSLSKTQCAVLALNGEKDLQVLIEPNFKAIRSSLKAAGNKDFELVAYPELNHLFQKSKTGSPSEYSTITETFNVDVMDKIVDWVQSH